MSLFPAHPDELGKDFARVDEILKSAVENGNQLTDWENEFVYDLVERLDTHGAKTRISEKQMEIIDRINGKLIDWDE